MRLDNWPRALADLVEARRATPFAWGSNDCATFAAEAARAITGEDYAAGQLGGYKTALGAARKLRGLGFASIEDLAAADLPEISPAFAQRGDLAIFDSAGQGPGLAVVLGQVIAAPGPGGLDLLRLQAARRAFRVG